MCGRRETHWFGRGEWRVCGTYCETMNDRREAPIDSVSQNKRHRLFDPVCVGGLRIIYILEKHSTCQIIYTIFFKKEIYCNFNIFY